MRFVCIGLIRLYQLFVSPLTPPSCRFLPSCSHYAADAFREYGVLRGSYLSAARVLRCNPWNAGGVDPLPTPRKGSRLCH